MPDNQYVVAEQLLRLGADVNKPGILKIAGMTPLHAACYGIYVTNLPLIRLLMENGADPNLLCDDGKPMTPLHLTIPGGLGAAKFLLTSYADRIDINIVDFRGWSFLRMVREQISWCGNHAYKMIGTPVEYTHRAKMEFLITQYRDLESIAVSLGAKEIGTPPPPGAIWHGGNLSPSPSAAP